MLDQLRRPKKPDDGQVGWPTRPSGVSLPKLSTRHPKETDVKKSRFTEAQIIDVNRAGFPGGSNV
jgi:hypothetical protein